MSSATSSQESRPNTPTQETVRASTQKPPATHRPKRTPLRIYGYILTDEFILDWGLKRGLCKPDYLLGQSIPAALPSLLGAAGVGIHCVVYSDENAPDGQKTYCALPLASNSSHPSSTKVTTKERIARVQKVIGTDELPRWYKVL